MAVVNPMKDSCYTIVWDGGSISKSGYTPYPKREAYMSLISATYALNRLIQRWLDYYYKTPVQKDSKAALLEAKENNRKLLGAINKLEIKRYIGFDSLRVKASYRQSRGNTYDGRKFVRLYLDKTELEDA